jgi:hypothetical protein
VIIGAGLFGFCGGGSYLLGERSSTVCDQVTTASQIFAGRKTIKTTLFNQESRNNNIRNTTQLLVKPSFHSTLFLLLVMFWDER